MADLDEYRDRIISILGSQKVPASTPDQKRRCSSLSHLEFPVPGLLHVALHEILGLRRYGPFEKMAWAFDLLFKGTKISVTLEKFGLRLHYPETLDPAAVTLALMKCCKIAEQHLKPLVAKQLDQSKVTLDNQFYRFDDAYRFFRNAAREAYDTPPPKPVVTETAFGTATQFRPFLSKQQGGYLASAMLDTYFSRLEHILVLMSAFTDLKLSDGELQRLVGSNWGEKFKMIFNISSDSPAKKIYDELTHLKESLRNPIAHGGFLKKGASFHFHSSAGALPVLLSRTNRDFELQISLVPPATYAEICALLDKADEFFASCNLSHAYEYIKFGLPIAMDVTSRGKYAAAIESGDFDAFLHREAELHERHMNMDY